MNFIIFLLKLFHYFFYSQRKTDIDNNLNYALNITNRPIFFVAIKKKLRLKVTRLRFWR